MEELFNDPKNTMAVIALVGAALTVFGIIAKKTKTKTDDKIVGALKKLFSMFTGRKS